MGEVEDPTGLRYYGSDMTIHDGVALDVEVDKGGHVVAVWFRCQPIRFKESVASKSRAREMRDMYEEFEPPALEAVVLQD